MRLIDHLRGKAYAFHGVIFLSFEASKNQHAEKVSP